MHHFHAGGLYNGLILLRDEETGTYWDHITGQGVHGPLAGHQLNVWSVNITDVSTALDADPDIQFAQGGIQKRSLMDRLMYLFFQIRFRGRVDQWKGQYPPGFKDTMDRAVDDRLPEMTTGLGVFESNTARFYPMGLIKDGPVEDNFEGQNLTIGVSKKDGSPYAERGDGSRPNQLFSRWYGFSFTFPQTTIFEQKEN